MSGELVPYITCIASVSPFDADERSATIKIPAGRTLADYVAEIKAFDPHARVTAFVNDVHVPEGDWTDTRPCAGDTVHIRAIPQEANDFLTIAIAAAALATGVGAAHLLGTGLAAAGVGSGLLGGAAGGAAVLGGWGSAVVTGITAAAVFKLGSQLFSPSETDRGRPNVSSSHDIRAARNQLNPDGAIPLVLGRHRMVPPLAAAPYTEIEGTDQYLRLLFAVGYGPLDDTIATEDLSARIRGVLPETRPGRTSLAPLVAADLPANVDADDALRLGSQAMDFRIGNTALNNFNNVEVEWDMEGRGDALPLYPNALRQDSFAIPLEFRLTDDDGNQLTRAVTTVNQNRDTGETTTTTRQVRTTGTGDWETRTTARNTTEIGMTIVFPRGLARLNSRNWVSTRFQFQFRAHDSMGDWESFSVGRRVNANQSQDIFDSTAQDFEGTIFDTEQGSGYNLHINDIRTAKGLDDAGRYTAPGDTDVTREESTYVQFSQGTVGPLRISFRLKGLPRGQYDVRIRRVAQGVQFDNEGFSDSIVNDAVWTALRSFDSTQPTIRRSGVAQVALRIKASDQLNGLVDQFNYLAVGLYPIWRGDGDPLNWSEAREDLRPSSNPAALYRYILRCDANQFPVPVEDIDDDMMGEWFQYCEEQGYEFNAIADNHRALDDVLRDVAAAGAARRAFIGNRWSVVIDRPQVVPVAHFVPRNTNNLRGRITSIEMPHALRIRFFNEDEDFIEDERVVHDDGYSGEDGEPSPSTIVDVDLPGITSSDNIWRFGRRYMAAARLRIEEWIFETGNEARRINVGDLCLLSSDVALIGIQSGRVKNGILDENGNSGLLLDEPVEVVETEIYIFRFTRPDGTIVQRNYGATETGLVDRIFGLVGETDSIPDGSIFSFGQVENDAQEVLISAIESQGKDQFRITAIPYDANVYNAEYHIPRYRSNIQRARSITFNGPPPPRVLYAAGNLSQAENLSEGVTKPRVWVYLENQNINTDIEEPIAHYQLRYTTPDFPNLWNTLPLFPGTRTALLIEDVIIDGIYTIQVRSIGPDGRNFSRWVEVKDIRVVNDFIKPLPCTTFTAQNNRLELNLDWEHPGGASLVGFQIRYNHIIPPEAERIREEQLGIDYDGETAEQKTRRVNQLFAHAVWRGMRIIKNVIDPKIRETIVGSGPGYYAIKAVNRNGLFSEDIRLATSTLLEEPSQALRRTIRGPGNQAFSNQPFTIRAGVQEPKLPNRSGGFRLDQNELRLKRTDEGPQGFTDPALYANAVTDDQRVVADFIGRQYVSEGFWRMFVNTGRDISREDGGTVDSGVRINSRIITEMEIATEWDRDDIAQWEDIADVVDLNGTPYGDNMGAFLQIRTTNDVEVRRTIPNPDYDPMDTTSTEPERIDNPDYVARDDYRWTPWVNVIRGDFSYTGIDVRVILFSNGPSVTPVIKWPLLWGDRLNTIVRGSVSIAPNQGPFTFVEYDQPFQTAPSVQIFAERSNRITEESRFGFNIHAGDNTDFTWEASGLGFEAQPGQALIPTVRNNEGTDIPTGVVDINSDTPNSFSLTDVFPIRGARFDSDGNRVPLRVQNPLFTFVSGGNATAQLDADGNVEGFIKDSLDTQINTSPVRNQRVDVTATSSDPEALPIPVNLVTVAYDIGERGEGQADDLNSDTDGDMRDDNPDTRFDDNDRDNTDDITTGVTDILNEVVDQFDIPSTPTGDRQPRGADFTQRETINTDSSTVYTSPSIFVPTIGGEFSNLDFSAGNFNSREVTTEGGIPNNVITVNIGGIDTQVQGGLVQTQERAVVEDLRSGDSRSLEQRNNRDLSDLAVVGGTVVAGAGVGVYTAVTTYLASTLPGGAAATAAANAIWAGLGTFAAGAAGIAGATYAWGSYVDGVVARDNAERAAADERARAAEEAERRRRQRGDPASEEEQVGSDPRGPHGPHPP